MLNVLVQWVMSWERVGTLEERGHPGDPEESTLTLAPPGSGHHLGSDPAEGDSGRRHPATKRSTQEISDPRSVIK